MSFADALKRAYERRTNEMKSPAYAGPNDRPAAAPRALWHTGEHVWETIGMIGSQSYRCVLCEFEWNVFNDNPAIPMSCESTKPVPADAYWHEYAREWRVAKPRTAK